jgi:hypothetical protein
MYAYAVGYQARKVVVSGGISRTEISLRVIRAAIYGPYFRSLRDTRIIRPVVPIDPEATVSLIFLFDSMIYSICSFDSID